MTTTQERNVPALRFPQFSGELDSLKLGSIAAFNKGKGISKADISNDGALECIRYGQLYTDYTETISDVKSRTNVLAGELVLSESNDIIIPASGETQIDIATASCVLKSGVALGGDLNIVKTKHDGVFLSYYLNSKRKHDIARLSQGISIVHLYAAQLKLLHLNLPSSTEQQKIASFLTSVDSKIEQLGKKKALLEQYKKGMMQKLFSQELRFKNEQGKDFPDWEEKRLGELIENIGGTALEKFTDPSSRYKFISIGNYSVEGKFIDNGQRVELNKKTKTKLLEKDNLVMVLNDKTASGDIIGSTILIDRGNTYIYNQRSERIICKPVVLPKYLWQYLNSTIFRSQVFRMAQGGTQIYVNFPVVKELKFLLPGVGEQQKIAKFLSALDNKIDLVVTELDYAETFKKGLLQQMFI